MQLHAACNSPSCIPCETRLRTISSCKHASNIEVFCSDAEKPWLLQLKCEKLCKEILECGHVCASKCSDCYGGYIHRSCTQNCDRLLYCGHKCDMPCSKNCAPCKRECPNGCVHSKCKLKCSQPCKPCLEECSLKCEHKKCSRKCHELCDIEPCSEPCIKTLKCGHQCIGLCGDPCPSLCRTCNKNKVKEIFFGTEDTENARFVLLKDCKHVMEATGMKEWIDSRYENNQTNSIQFPECPKCRTQIRNTLRYSNIIKKQLHLIEKIKIEQYGKLAENKKTQNDLLKEIKLFEKSEKLKHPQKTLLVLTVSTELSNNRRDFSYNELVLLRNTWNIFERLHRIDSNISLLVQTPLIRFQKELIQFEVNKLFALIFDRSAVVSNVRQRIKEIYNETERVESILNYFILRNLAHVKSTDFNASETFKINTEFRELSEFLFGKVYRFNEVKNRVDASFNELKKIIKNELSNFEKKMIVEAMGLSQGFKLSYF